MMPECVQITSASREAPTANHLMSSVTYREVPFVPIIASTNMTPECIQITSASREAPTANPLMSSVTYREAPIVPIIASTVMTPECVQTTSAPLLPYDLAVAYAAIKVTAKKPTKKKYKPVALKVRPVLTDLPDKFRIIRNITGDPLMSLSVAMREPTKTNASALGSSITKN